jgi:hypothetical protein
MKMKNLTTPNQCAKNTQIPKDDHSSPTQKTDHGGKAKYQKCCLDIESEMAKTSG